MSSTGNFTFKFSADIFTGLLIVLKKAQYRFVTFSEVMKSGGSPSERTCLLRHDVDVSMDYALDMARIEHEQGIRSTYFVMLRSPLYNLLSRHNADVLGQIMSLGHEIGLHFDAGCVRRPGKEVEEDIIFELDVLAELTGRKIQAFSFHQPSEEVIRRGLSVLGVINTYHPHQLAAYKYISDSNRIWRDNDPFELASSGVPHIHLLLHPIWWMCSCIDIEDCWDRAIERNFGAEQRQLLATERAYGPRRRLALSR